MSICLLWKLSLSLALHRCHLSLSLLVVPYETLLYQNCVTSLFSICRPLSYSIPPAPTLCYPSHASPHLARLHSWESTEKAEKIEKQACDSNTGGQDSGWPETFRFLLPTFLSSRPPLSLLHLSVSFSHTILFLSIHHLLLYQFSNSVLPLQREPCRRSQPGLAVGRVNWGECDWREGDMCQQSSSSQTDECGWQWMSSPLLWDSMRVEVSQAVCTCVGSYQRA